MLGQLPEFIVVVQRRHFNPGLRQAHAEYRKQHPVDHGQVKLQVVAHQRPAADEMHQLHHRVVGADAMRHILLAQPVDSHTVGGQTPLFRPHQQFQALAGHDAVAPDAHRADGDDVVSPHIQPRGFTVQRHPFVLGRRVPHEAKARVAQVVQHPLALERPRPLTGCQARRIHAASR